MEVRGDMMQAWLGRKNRDDGGERRKISRRKREEMEDGHQRRKLKHEKNIVKNEERKGSHRNLNTQREEKSETHTWKKIKETHMKQKYIHIHGRKS